MKITEIDSRDTGWETSPTAFRVALWEPAGTAVSHFDLTGCDVWQCLAWISSGLFPHVGRWELSARIDVDGQPGLVLLAEGDLGLHRSGPHP